MHFICLYCAEQAVFRFIWSRPTSYISFAFQVKYRMEGAKAKTMSNYDGEAREIAHVKNVTDLISKVSLYPMSHFFCNSLLTCQQRLATDTILKCEYALLLQVLYRQKWDETKDRYLLPPDAPELVLAVKNAANYSKVRALKRKGIIVPLFTDIQMVYT